MVPAGLKILASKRRMLPPCRIMASLNQKLKLSSGHFGFVLTLNQKGKKGDNVLAEMIDTIIKENARLLPHMQVGTEDCI